MFGMARRREKVMHRMFSKIFSKILAIALLDGLGRLRAVAG
jgi:hypothetical protein